MSGADLLLAGIRWLHGLAAVAWIGAILFEFLVLSPDVLDELSEYASGRVARARRELVQGSLITFLATGAVLTFDRLSKTGADVPYVAVLSSKVLLAVVMFQIAFRTRAARGLERMRALGVLAALGALVMFLAAILKGLFEQAVLP